MWPGLEMTLPSLTTRVEFLISVLGGLLDLFLSSTLNIRYVESGKLFDNSKRKSLYVRYVDNLVSVEINAIAVCL
jgi:hypothetical protein